MIWRSSRTTQNLNSKFRLKYSRHHGRFHGTSRFLGKFRRVGNSPRLKTAGLLRERLEIAMEVASDRLTV